MQKTNSKTNPAHFCAYIDAGMVLFPCAGYSKIPARKGFLEWPFDVEFVPEDQNYGVLLKNRYLVIDCDPRSYKENDKPLNRMLTELELDPAIFKQTFTVRTPRGGYHIYFRKPESVDLVSSLKDYPGLEFKTKFIMACGSYLDKSPKGEPIERNYTPVFHSPAHIMKCPQILLVKLKKTDAPIITLNTPIVPDNASDVYLFTQHCQNVQPAIEGQSGDLRTYQVACAGREFGLSQAKTLEIMSAVFNPRCTPPWDEATLALKVQNAYEYSTRTPQGIKSIQNSFTEVEDNKKEVVNIRYHLDRNGQLKKNMFNLKMFFEFPTLHQNTERANRRVLNIPPIGNFLRFDQFSHNIIWGKPAPWYKSTNEWSDEDAIEFKNILSEQLSMDFPTDLIHEVASICASKRAFHPVRDYIDACVWDGLPRVDTWLSKYCGALDNVYTRFIGRKVLVAAIARVFAPGTKFDHVLVMEGAQGIGKSYLWEILAAPWFTDAPLHIHDKSAIEIMRGKWVVELAEMDALSRYESQTIKGFLSRNEDRCRLAYERKAKNFPRQNIFVGSLNPEMTGWLKDKTGNRRYWPVAVSKVNLAELKRVKHELWAEAYQYFQQGEQLYVNDNAMRDIMSKEVENRMQEDPWFSTIEDHLRNKFDDYRIGNGLEVNPADLYSRCMGGTPSAFKTYDANRIATILKTLGFGKQKVPGKFGYVYYKKISNEEVL